MYAIANAFGTVNFMAPAHGQSHGSCSHGGEFDSAHLSELLEVEGQLSLGVLQDSLRITLRWLSPAVAEPQSVIDLGAGPGVGTAALAEAFAKAEVVAVDASQLMLDRAAARFGQLGLGGRIQLRRMDLDGDLTTLGHADLVLAAMSLHHATDEVATLARIRALIEPAGLLCVLERADPNSVRLSDDLGRPGIWERFDAAWQLWFGAARSQLPGAHNTERYPQMLDDAGLELVETRSLSMVVDPPDDPATRRFVEAQLRRTAVLLLGHADAEDVSALQHLLSAASGADLWQAQPAVRISRRLFVARPESLSMPISHGLVR